MSAFVKSTGSATLESKWEMSLRPLRKTRELEVAGAERSHDATPNPPSGYSGIEERSTPFHAFLEHSTTFLFPLLFILVLYFSIARLYELERLWLVGLAIPLSLLLSDFVTGLVHWAADTYGSEETPVVGPSLVKPFRLHHIYPRDICTHNLVTTVGNACIPAVPVVSFCLYLMWVMPSSGWLRFAILCVALMSLATVATNQFHKWAHQETPSDVVRWLQRARFVLVPSHHELHHTEPFNMNYCITNGWLNPLLNKIKFFRRLEAALRFLGIEAAKAKKISPATMLTEAGAQLALSCPSQVGSRPEAR